MLRQRPDAVQRIVDEDSPMPWQTRGGGTAHRRLPHPIQVDSVAERPIQADLESKHYYLVINRL